MIKKYEFGSQEEAYNQLNATPKENGFLNVEGAENAKDMGHWPIIPAVYKFEGGDGMLSMSKAVEVTPAVLSEKYLVDVMWLKEAPSHLSKYEVSPMNPVHNFFNQNKDE